MRAVLNVIWLLLGGIWLALGYALAGVIACLFIITIPVGIASFRMARYVLWPFGSAVVAKPGAGAASAAMNLIWLVTCGWWLALGHLITALAQSLTVVGIAVAVVNLKMLPVTLMPFGKQIVDADRLAPGRRPLHSV